MAAMSPTRRHDATTLDSLLEESAVARQAVDAPSDEPIPTLTSLLLSTAQDLAMRSKQLAQSNGTAKVKVPPAFALVSNPQALLASQTSSEYLASLLAMPLPTLQALPNSLATLSSSLDTDLSSLAFTRYSSFLLAHSATQSISNSFNTLSASLDGFIDSTDSLKQVVSAFEQRVSEPRRKRERMTLVRERMEEVEELMEAPSVVDACVRAGLWAEAIDVSVRLSELHARLSRTSSHRDKPDQQGALLILSRVKEQVSVALLSLRARVLESLLQRGLKLPGAVRGIGVLRRIAERGFSAPTPGAEGDELDEDSLRVVFLAARWRCLRGELENVEAQMAASGIRLLAGSTLPPEEPKDQIVGAEENEERTRWTKRWIEVWREIVGETVGMYTEVFLSSSSIPAAVNADKPFVLPSTAPLALFLTTALSSLSEVFSSAVPALTSPSSLSSLLTQLSYCSHSFARHGLEFRELQQFRERVEVRVGRIIAHEWEVAGRKWEKDWRDGWEGNLGSAVANARRNHLLGGRPPISDWLVAPEGLAQVFATPTPPAVDAEAPAESWHQQPQQALALLPPLARFLNAHATALNSLRLLPPLSLYPSLLAAQSHELDRATQVLAAFTDAWLASVAAAPPLPESPEEEWSSEERLTKQLREDEKRLVTFAVAAFGRWVVPWCEGGLKHGVYSELSSDSSHQARRQGVIDAIRRCEGIVARIEQREREPEPEAAAAEAAVAPVTTNGTMLDDAFLEPPVGTDGVDPAIVEASLKSTETTSNGGINADTVVPLGDDAAAEPAIEDLPVEQMPLVNPPEDVVPEAQTDTPAAAPETEIVVEDGDADADGWGIGGGDEEMAEEPTAGEGEPELL